MENEEFQGPFVGNEIGVEVSIYDTSSGRIVASGRYKDIAEAWLNVQDGQSIILGMFDPDNHDVIDGVAVPLPPRPSERHYYDWDANTWVDSWTIDRWNKALQERREVASLSRIDFVLACSNFGLLSHEEALIAVDGGFPAAFQAIIDGMEHESEKFEAQIRWKGATVIDRNMALIINMGAAINIDEWSLDAVFGVAWPEPLPEWPEGQLHP